MYSKEIKLLTAGKVLNRNSSLLSFDAKRDGLLHVGGRLDRSKLLDSEKTPIYCPASIEYPNS